MRCLPASDAKSCVCLAYHNEQTLKFGVGFFDEFFLLILLWQATAGTHCREELRPFNRSLSRRRPLNRSIKRRIPTEFGEMFYVRATLHFKTIQKELEKGKILGGNFDAFSQQQNEVMLTCF